MPTFSCPICEKKVTVANRLDAPYRPFCSKRCKQVDLGRWLSEEYKISEPIPDARAAEDEADAGDGDHDGVK